MVLRLTGFAAGTERLAQLLVALGMNVHRLAEARGLCQNRILLGIRLTADIAETFLLWHCGLNNIN